MFGCSTWNNVIHAAQSRESFAWCLAAKRIPPTPTSGQASGKLAPIPPLSAMPDTVLHAGQQQGSLNPSFPQPASPRRQIEAPATSSPPARQRPLRQSPVPALLPARRQPFSLAPRLTSPGFRDDRLQLVSRETPHRTRNPTDSSHREECVGPPAST